MLTGSVGKRVIEPGQVERPLGLMLVQSLGHSKIHEVPMVIQDLDCVFGPFQYMSLSRYDFIWVG